MSNNPVKIHLIAMIRDEADILPAFITRTVALFDQIHVVDHQSTDGSRQMLERIAADCDKVFIYDYLYEAYYQDAVSNCLARHAIKQGADWIFILDADEFLDIDNRVSLVNLLETFPHYVMQMRWINLAPTEYGTFQSFDLNQPLRWNGTFSSYCKIAFKRTFALQNPGFFLHAGNHAISPSRCEPPVPAAEGCPLLHVPVRSLERFRYKAAIGARSYRAKSCRLPTEGFHKFELHERLEQGNVTVDWINGVIARYGEPLDLVKPENTTDKGWTPKYIPGNSGLDLYSFAASLADTIDSYETLTKTELVTVGGGMMRADLCDRNVTLKPQPMSSDGEPYQGSFSSLPVNEGGEPISFDPNQVADSLARAFLGVKTVVPSAWSEHTPFLFALFRLMRPRRYVEIGTHFGMSFFAAVQAASDFEIGTQCIAIDGWIGDEHAGFYDNEIFTAFKAKLASLGYANSYYIRSFFEQSLSCFDDASIDLLHIDGLHTYEAVKRDYETWLPKLSSRGVILFHDTNVYERDFGVWRLWNELKGKYPHCHFPHCHGLGVIYVGTESSPIATLLESLEQNDVLTKAAISIFGGLGAMSIKNSVLEEEKRLLEHEKQMLKDELLTVRAENVSLITHAEELRAGLRAILSSTSWKMSVPVRMMGRISKHISRSIRGDVRGLAVPHPHMSDIAQGRGLTTEVSGQNQS